MHHGLEQVVVHPHPLIERGACCDLLWSIQAQFAKILPHQGVVFLLYVAVIILLVRAAPRELHPCHFLFPEPYQMRIEELRPIIGMQLFDRKGQPLEYLGEGHFHRPLASSQEHYSLAPASSHIDQLQGVPILSCCTLSPMMHQIGLEVAWLFRVPGDASHRYSFGHLIGSVRAWTR